MPPTSSAIPSTPTPKSAPTPRAENPRVATLAGRPTDTLVPITVQETPMIMKNREMRSGGGRRSGVAGMANGAGGAGEGGANEEGRKRSPRRTSLTRRGKRISSSGKPLEQMPHDTIDPAEFYKHLDADLPEPVRMRQLMIWCADRVKTKRGSIAAKKEPDAGAIEKAVIAIEKELIEGLQKKRINTSWYNSDDAHQDGVTYVPNPVNLENASRKAEYEKELARLLDEERTWLSLLQKAKDEAEAARLQPVQDLEKALAPEDRTLLDAYCRSASMEEELASLQKFAKDSCDDFEFAVHNMEHVTLSAKQEVTDSMHRCESLFKNYLIEYETEMRRTSKKADPIDVLRLLQSSSSSSAGGSSAAAGA
ncbi:hypothetical protein HK101_007806 [Irineochytrium annulatum]|nr:hypothetical protein HK101_007806 [Irineochytrium annulatum]